MAQESVRGRFVWYDLATTDPTGAIAFYRDIVGWGTEEMPMDPPYTMWVNGDRPLGGVVPLPEGAPSPPHWMSYLGTPDLDVTLARARELGANVVRGPEEIPDIGRFAVITDPQGAYVSFYSPTGESPDPGPPCVGDFSWHELMIDDYESAFAFYAELFGWQVLDEHDMGDAGVYLIYGRDDRPLGGIFNRPPGVPYNAWIYYVMVDDVDRQAAAVVAAGGEILHGPLEVPGGDRIVQIRDPQGAVLALHAVAST